MLDEHTLLRFSPLRVTEIEETTDEIPRHIVLILCEKRINSFFALELRFPSSVR